MTYNNLDLMVDSDKDSNIWANQMTYEYWN